MADATEFHRLSQLLEQGLTTLREEAVKAANGEHAYRKLVAETWLQAPPGDVRKGGLSEAQRTAWVQARTADARQVRDIAEALKLAALEAVRSRRAQLSYHQTLLNAEREELALARTEPR